MPEPGKADNDFTDRQLLDELARLGARLLVAGQHRLAALGDVTDDPRWATCPLPLRFEAQLPVLVLGALDAFDVTIGLLRARASQQGFSTLRFQMETLALIRWMAEPTSAADRQHRAYRVTCGQVTRFGRFMMRDAGRDREALDGVRAVREWGKRLREIAAEDEIQHLKGPPRTPDLFHYVDIAGYPSYSMFSEFGSHPGTAASTFFALAGESSKQISHDPQGGLVERALFVATAIMYMSTTLEAASAALGWDDWLNAAVLPINHELTPLMAESARRRRAKIIGSSIGSDTS